jgi:hypothetical protein
MVPQKIKNLTLERGLLCNMIILKSDPPYYAFTLIIKVTQLHYMDISTFELLHYLCPKLNFFIITTLLQSWQDKVLNPFPFSF